MFDFLDSIKLRYVYLVLLVAISVILGMGKAILLFLALAAFSLIISLYIFTILELRDDLKIFLEIFIKIIIAEYLWNTEGSDSLLVVTSRKIVMSVGKALKVIR